jgi:hypothetical protein
MKMKNKCCQRIGLIFAIALLGAVAGCEAKKGSLADDAGGRKPEDFPELAEDVFKPLDGGIALSQDEIKGRNTWNLWCAGDEQFWERMSRESFGLIDLLKTIDSRKRGSRFKELGLINEPGFKPATKPDKYGLWIDEPIEGQGESAAIDPKVYGRPSGIMGFRIFDNPDFNGDAAKNWSGEKYYNDSDYAVNSKLVRPYRVGISCGSCHIAFNPCNPPADPENPKWENLASAIANQYIREGAVFASNVKPGGFFWEMLKAQPPGTSDTSRIATDHINNPNTINPIFELGARLGEGEEEVLAGDTLNLPTVTEKMKVPHVLKDGADSVGVPGATLRVYINIGSYSQHWLQQHNALIGLSPQKPFSIKTAQENSVYWRASQTKFQNVAKFFMRLKSFRLEDAPGGKDFLTKDEAVMNRGRIVFAENCATCHSSKQPPENADATEWFRAEVMKADFRDGNFFSDERRYPITKIKSNASRACGTNAKRGHIWDAFSSETYKKQESVGDIDVWNPITGETEKFTVPSGGTGYYRTPSLISCWSSAPFLHNNALGKFTGDPSVKGRLDAFNDAVEKLLWPEKRLGTNSIWRTSQECQLQIQLAVIPEPLRTALKPHADSDGYFRIGPIPEGTPINLLANVDPEASLVDLGKLCIGVKTTLARIKLEHLDSAAARELLRKEVAPQLWKVSKCPDFVEDRGHYFGTELPDADKLALIEFLKTL